MLPLATVSIGLLVSAAPLLAQAPAERKNLEAVLTIVGGRVVHER